MTAGGQLAWFARHELTLAWRDWASLMAGGKTAREHAATLFAFAFIGLLHWLAYALLKPAMSGVTAIDTATLVLITATLLSAFTMILSQAIEQVTRAFYARADLDLILSSPAAAEHVFAVRIASIAVTGAAMTALLAAPLINVAAWLGGVQYLSAYAVVAALAMLATAIAVAATVAMFKAMGPKRTRFAAQIIAAVVGAALLIGLQVAAILSDGNLSRLSVLRSAALANIAPAPDSPFWLPARAVLGDPSAILAVLAVGLAALTFAIVRHAHQFGHHAVAASSAVDGDDHKARVERPFKSRSIAATLRAKEWTLLGRDPWLLSQTLMQVLYLLPPALLLWRDMGSNAHVDIILAPVLVMAFGQLAGGLAWLAISGEDAHELVATAPMSGKAITRAKIEAVLLAVAAVAAPLIAGLSFVSVTGALFAFTGICAASCSAVAIQIWFRSTAKRAHFRRRQTASKAATFAEAFSSIFWAAATGFAVSNAFLVSTAFAAFALAALAVAKWLSPREI